MPRPSFLRQSVKHLLRVLVPQRYFVVRAPCEGVYLTFDDGPNPEHTPRLLDVLHECDTRATFFVIGRNVQRHPEIVRRIVAEGHTIGNHSYNHLEPRTVSARQLLEEVKQTRQLVADITGIESVLFRPPWGKLSVAKLCRLWVDGQQIVLWDADPGDYRKRTTADVARWFVDSPLQPGTVVLMHDDRPFAAELLPGVIREARARGLEFSSLPQWVGRRATQPVKQKERGALSGQPTELLDA